MVILWIFLIFLGCLLISGLAVFLFRRKRSSKPRKPFRLGFETSGARGERIVGDFLRALSWEGDKLICDIIVTNPDTGMTAQIDHIFLSTRGIFVIETKNYGGSIFGGDTEKTWQQMLPGTVNTFYSPVKQNATHIFVLKRLTHTRLFLENIVIFPRADTSNVESGHVFSLQQFQEYLSALKPVCTPQARDGLYEALLALQRENTVTKREHIGNIRQKQREIAHRVCPRCGAPLVKINGIYGIALRCSNYPDCTFTTE